MDFIKCEPDSDDESYPTSSQNQNLLSAVKEDEDPLFIRCPLMKTENEVSGMSFLVDVYDLRCCLQQGNLVELLVWALLPCCKNRPV